jgi:alanine racemase
MKTQKHKTQNLYNIKLKKNLATWIELDKKKFIENISILKKIIKKRLFSLVVKANAYGHGLLPIAKMAEVNSNIDYLCTFKLTEAIFLRKHKIKKPILILGLLDTDLKLAIKNNIDLTIFDTETAIKLNKIATKLNKIVNIHIKIDTGLSRLGFLHNDIESIIQISKLKYIHIKGIFSHFSESDIEDDSFTNLQLQRFNELINALEKFNIKIPLKHIENSSATIRFKNNLKNFNFVRIGGAAYGITKEYIGETFPININPIFKWKARLISKKNIPCGSYISYARTHQVKRDTTIGIIPVGYSEGYDRRFSNNSFVLINNQKVKILGRICMNMIILDITDIHANIGDEVILISDHPELNPTTLAKSLGSINYELLTGINTDIIRIIKE